MTVRRFMSLLVRWSSLRMLLALVVPITATLQVGCLPAPAGTGPTAAVFVLDLSGSSRSGDRCAEVGPRLDVLVAGHRSVSILILGTGTGTLGEPVVLVPWRSYSPARAFLHGASAGESRAGQWRTSMVAACRRAATSSGSSPVYQAVRRGLEGLQAECRERERSGRRCGQRLLFVHSDLRTNRRDPVGRRIAALARGRNGTNVPALDAEGVTTTVCGVAESHSRGQSVASAVETAWREFLAKSDLIIAPTCPQPATEVTP